jgi:1-acyl-sn-glycerol-3-phosphate acyltransferase
MPRTLEPDNDPGAHRVTATETSNATVTALDRPVGRGALARIAAWLLRQAGWCVVLAQPVPRQCVIVFAPHTSNWDFVVGLLAKWVIGLRVRFVAKDSLFATPLAPLFKRWGGIPVNRREHTGFIERMRTEFARGEELRLAIAPEGTRSYTDHWKSGFYHLARAVGVPVALAFIDYEQRTVGIGAYVELSEDVDADMARIASFYLGKRGRNLGQQGPVRLLEPPQTGEPS